MLGMTIVTSPANISVISARWRPLNRRAGKPRSVPIAPVSSPASSRTIGNGSEVRNKRRAAIQLPTTRSPICPSETSPTRPKRRLRPSATIEKIAAAVITLIQ